MNKIIIDDNGRKYERVSRWIKVYYDYITKRHSLADYADFYDSEDGKGLLNWFQYNGKKYAVGQFLKLAYPYFYKNEDGKISFLCGYDCENYYNPLLIEIDDDGESVRLYREVTED